MRLQKSITSLFLVLACTFVFMLNVDAAIEATQFDDAKTEQRYQKLIAELRCLVCQNQNLADSDASLAKDLRRKTAEMLQQGQSDQQILDYMRERYGDFVLYNPPFSAATSLLWLAPALLLFIALIIIYRHTNKNSENDAHQESQIQHDDIRKLLAQTPDLEQQEHTRGLDND